MQLGGARASGNCLFARRMLLATALLATGSAVQSQSLEIYGLAHMSGDRLDTGTVWQSNLASNSSRLGVRGQYEFKEDFALVYQYESGVDLTFKGTNSDGNGGSNDGNAVFTKTRPSYVGVDTKLGKLVYGHIDWLDQWTNEFNLFADQVGDLGNFWAASGFPGRLDDVIQYSTPDALPGYFAAAVRPSGDVRGEAYMLRGGWAMRGWNVSFTHTELEPGRAHNEDGLGTGPSEPHRAQVLSIYHRGDGFAIGMGLQRETDAVGRLGHERLSYTVGGSIMLTPDFRLRSLAASTTDSEPESGAFMIAMGTDYLHNDNLTLYLDLAAVNNEANAAFSVSSKGHGNGVTPLPGHDQLVLSLGFIATFNAQFF